MKYLVYVQRSDGGIVWECSYQDIGEAIKDIVTLEKPSVFGVSEYQIVIQRF